MKNDTNDVNRQAATSARAYLEKRITWQEFMDQTAQLRSNRLIEGLIDLIEHEPKRGGFAGLSESEWREYQRQLRNTIDLLER